MNRINKTFYKQTKYLIFEGFYLDDRKTPIINVLNKSDEKLGVIKFYPAWRKFIFESSECIYDSSCLTDLIEVLDEQQEVWKQSLNNNKD